MPFTVKTIVYSDIEERYENIRLEHLLLDSSTITFSLPLGATFDDVFHKCTKACSIAPLYLPLFALRDENSNWINLDSPLINCFHQHGEVNYASSDSADSEVTEIINVELRVRFTFRGECEIEDAAYQAHRYTSYDDSCQPVFNEVVCKYFFHQRRSDYLSGKLCFFEKQNDKVGAALGVAVLDVFRLASEMKCELAVVLKKLSKYKKLLPLSCKETIKCMNIYSRLKVELNFRNFVQKQASEFDSCLQSGWTNANFYCKYLRNLILLVGFNDLETYDLAPGSNEKDFRRIIIGSQCGIVSSDGLHEKQWCDFHEIADMQIYACEKDSQPIWVVKVSQINGKKLTLSLSKKTDAESLASGIDGYYQLLIDAHHYLCREVASPSLVERLSCYCHGPISCAYAESYIRKQPQTQAGDCLLRQSQVLEDEYYVSTVVSMHPSILIKEYYLDRQQAEDEVCKLGIYGDSEPQRYLTLASLFDVQENDDEAPFRRERLIHPNTDYQSTLKVYKCSDKHPVEDKKSKCFEKVGSAAIIMQKDYSYVQLLGSGRYSTVKLLVHKANSKHKVVIKKVFESQERYDLGMKQYVEESFQVSILMLSFLKNDYIVRLLGKMKNMMALEYVPFGSITDYMENIVAKSSFLSSSSMHKHIVWEKWFLNVLWQLAHACNYLEENSCAHGNIRGKNVLVWQDFPQPHIKLADSGVHTCCRTVNNRNVAEPVLTTPWLAIEFCRIDCEVNTTTYPTIDGDKWSYATTVCEIFDWGNLQHSIEQQSAYQLSDKMKDAYVSGNAFSIPNTLASIPKMELLIRQCWSMYPTRRPAFKKILREIGALLASDHLFVSTEPPKIKIESFTSIAAPVIEAFEDASLVFIKPIGGGNFGHVDLYKYHTFDGGVEHFAVKSLIRTLNDAKSASDFNNEMETMRKINHKYVVKIRGVAEPSMRIVLEYLPYGPLTKFLQHQQSNNIPLPSLYEMLYRFCSQISLGMLAVQEKRLVHRDLALRNILLARENQHSPYFVKISDFGLSRTLAENSNCYTGNRNDVPAQWYAPECLGEDGQTAFHFESDVWSFGVTVWEMFSYGCRPSYESLPGITIKSITDLHQQLKEGLRLPQPTQCPNNVYSLIRSCWGYEPSEREKFEELSCCFDDLATSRKES